ncbi:MAG: pyrophosphate--fructose-6-phosphate 1-phosphotransferase [Propionibacteriaceae bacterium]|jgi:pyrophosphate--fructose-6-phosphate 1-phosphotransferase|nr:pyrophosphate--fructose-6-phosphate 1-phosphotransferase [Propionibacteriaceae bacterium]
MVQRVAILTAGGFAPCLSAAIGGLITRYAEAGPEWEIICYRHGYEGLLKGDYVLVTPEVRDRAHLLTRFGGSPVGNSRVKLTNTADLIKRGLIPDGEDDALDIAASQLEKDGVDILHTVGGDDTNSTAADLAAYLAEHNYDLTVVGLPKTIDNDIVPIRQSLGADTAAEQGALFARNVMAEHNAGPHTMIVHEVMGRNCGWLTAATARKYRTWLTAQEWLPSIGLSQDAWDIHAVYVPEKEVDLAAEADRLKKVMNATGCVNIFLSEGAGVETIVAEMEARGDEVPRDAFGHVRLDQINPGNWFAKQFAGMIGAQKVLVQKSGYFARSAAPNGFDLDLIGQMVKLGVQCALDNVPGVIGHDEDDNDILRPIEFPRIAGHKPFDVTQDWYTTLLQDIGQE